MAQEPDSLVLRYLRRLDKGQQEMREGIAELKRRMSGVEEGLVGVNRRLDRLIERRLELAEA